MLGRQIWRESCQTSGGRRIGKGNDTQEMGWERKVAYLSPLPYPNPIKAIIKRDFHSPDSPNQKGERGGKTNTTNQPKRSDILKADRHFHPYSMQTEKQLQNKSEFCSTVQEKKEEGQWVEDIWKTFTLICSKGFLSECLEMPLLHLTTITFSYSYYSGKSFSWVLFS